MDRRELLQAMGTAAVVPFAMSGKVEAQSVGKDTVYELRIYHTYEGELEPLVARFRGPERPLFEKHGMHPVAFWTPTDEPMKGKTFIYILRHTSCAAADESWKNFRADPEWVKLKAESEANGAFVEKYDITFMALTDFSPVI
jgi:hypothetical protein